MRQVLAEACRGHLVRLQKGWDEHWRAKAAELDRLADGKPPPAAFLHDCRLQHVADSAICLR